MFGKMNENHPKFSIILSEKTKQRMNITKFNKT